MRKHNTLVKNLEELSDEELWKGFKNGDKHALTSIFLQHYDSLFSYSARLTANSDEAKDIIQDLFLKIWNTRHNLGDCNNIRYYLLQSVRNLFIDQHQKKKKPFTTEIKEELLPAELPFESQLIRDQEQAHLSNELKKALLQLSARQQEAVYLRYYQQIDYPSISAIMGVNVQSARNLVHTAIQQLKQQLNNVVMFFLTFFKKS